MGAAAGAIGPLASAAGQAGGGKGGGGGGGQAPMIQAPSVFVPSAEGYLEAAQIQAEGARQAAQVSKAMMTQVIQNLGYSAQSANAELSPLAIQSFGALDQMSDLLGLAKPKAGSYNAYLDIQHIADQRKEVLNNFNRQMDEKQEYLDQFKADYDKWRARVDKYGKDKDAISWATRQFQKKYPEMPAYENYGPDPNVPPGTNATTGGNPYYTARYHAEDQEVTGDQYDDYAQDYIDYYQNQMKQLKEEFNNQNPGLLDGQFLTAEDYQGVEMQPGDPSKVGEILKQVPGYQFRLDQGRVAMENSAAAKGLLQSGQFMNAIQAYGQNFATDELNQQLNRLGTTAQLGLPGIFQASSQTMAGGQAQASMLQQLSDTIANSRLAASQARAAGVLGASQHFVSADAEGAPAGANVVKFSSPSAVGRTSLFGSF